MEATLLFRPDDVVRRGRDGREVTDPRRVEEEPVEGRDTGHGACIEHLMMEARQPNESTYDLLVKGLHFLKTGHPHQAVVVLEKAKLAEPEKGSIREALGRALYMTGRWPRARLEFAKAVAIDPVNHYAHFALGLTCARTGEMTRAIAHLKLAVAMSPQEEYQQALERLTG
jgi:tetratricopeptide (TPR) repeat protein